MNHAKEIIEEVRKDGDINAVVIRIRDTGDRSAPEVDRYRHVINHGLARVPVGCQVIKSDKMVRMKTVSSDKTNIIVQFDKDHADVNLRIW